MFSTQEPDELPKTEVITSFTGYKNESRSFETLLIFILTFWLFFFTKREIGPLELGSRDQIFPRQFLYYGL